MFTDRRCICSTLFGHVKTLPQCPFQVFIDISIVGIYISTVCG